MSRRAWAMLAATLLSGCSWGGPPPSHADMVTAAECDRRGDEIYALRHPEAVYRQDNYTSSLRDAPFATSGLQSNPTQGLSNQYEYDQIVRDCMRSTGSVGPTPAAPPVAAPGDAQ